MRKLINETRGVSDKFLELAFKLTKEYQIKTKVYHRDTYISRYKVFDKRLKVTTGEDIFVAGSLGTDNKGDMLLSVNTSGKNFETIAHEVAHAFQQCYKRFFGTNKTSVSHSGGSIRDYGYIFSYCEMQARLHGLVAYLKSGKYNSYDIDHITYRVIMKNMLKELDIPSTPKEKLFKMERFEVNGLDKKYTKRFIPSFIRKTRSLLPSFLTDKENEIIEEEYEKFKKEMKKRYLWFMDRCYYWMNEITPQNNTNPLNPYIDEYEYKKYLNNVNKDNYAKQNLQFKKEEVYSRMFQKYVEKALFNGQYKISKITENTYDSSCHTFRYKGTMYIMIPLKNRTKYVPTEFIISYDEDDPLITYGYFKIHMNHMNFKHLPKHITLSTIEDENIKPVCVNMIQMIQHQNETNTQHPS